MFSGPRDESGNGAPTVSSQPEPWIAPDAYLEAERRAETKSEYVDGRVLAMAGASRRHNLVVGNLVATLTVQLRDRPCEVYPSDMRLRVPESRLYTYPDVSVVCGTPELEDERGDTLLYPTVLIEVLSDSTERQDRWRKSEAYRRLATLQEYLLVSWAEPRVEHYRRHGEREWLLTEVVGLEERVELASVPCALALRDVYDRVF